MADIEFKIEGLDAVLKKLRALPIDTKSKGARFAGRKAANLIRDAVIRGAESVDDPGTAEKIASNVVVRFSSRQFRSTGDVGFRIGVLGGARQVKYETRISRRFGKQKYIKEVTPNPGGDTWYWRLVEFGTQNTPARPFMRPALERNTGAATDEFANQLSRWLDRYYKRTGTSPVADE